MTMTTTAPATPSARDVYYQKQETASLPAGAILLATLGVLAALLGVLALSEATTGVGMIAAGCFLGIAARLVQASAQHKAIIRAIRAADPEL